MRRPVLLDLCVQLQAVVQATTPAAVPAEAPTAGVPTAQPGHGRRLIPAHVERRTEIHDLSPQEKRCPWCGREQRCIGEECSCQYEYVPARLIAVEHVQKKYACVCTASTVHTAPKPSSPIEKGLATPSLLSHLITSKYLDHLPLHRQEGMLARIGIGYPRSTMWAQIRAAGELMMPLYKVAKQEVLASRILATDDTTVKVLDRTRTKTRTGNVWTYVGDDAHPLIVYDYTAGIKGGIKGQSLHFSNLRFSERDAEVAGATYACRARLMLLGWPMRRCAVIQPQPTVVLVRNNQTNPCLRASDGRARCSSSCVHGTIRNPFASSRSAACSSCACMLAPAYEARCLAATTPASRSSNRCRNAPSPKHQPRRTAVNSRGCRGCTARPSATRPARYVA